MTTAAAATLVRVEPKHARHKKYALKEAAKRAAKVEFRPNDKQQQKKADDATEPAVKVEPVSTPVTNTSTAATHSRPLPAAQKQQQQPPQQQLPSHLTTNLAPKEFDGNYDVAVLPNDNAIPSYYIDENGQLAVRQPGSQLAATTARPAATPAPVQPTPVVKSEPAQSPVATPAAAAEPVKEKKRKRDKQPKDSDVQPTAAPIEERKEEAVVEEPTQKKLKKAKKDKQQHDTPVQPAPTSNDITSHRDPRPSLVPRETVDYYKQIGELLTKNEFDSPDEEIPILLNNVLTELSAQGNVDTTWSLCIHPIISRIIEQLLEVGSVEHVIRCMSLVKELYVDLAFNKNGCHLIEALLYRAPRILIAEQSTHSTHDDSELPTFTSLFTSMLQSFSSAGWQHFLTDMYATFPLRSILHLLDGHVDLRQFTTKNGKGRHNNSGARRYQQQEIDTAHVQPYQQYLTSIIQSIINVDSTELAKFAYSSTSSPVLQLLLQSLHTQHQTSDLQQFVIKLLQLTATLEPTKQSSRTLSDMLVDRVASHLIEVLVQLQDTQINETVLEILTADGGDTLTQLACDSVANYPVQKLFLALTTTRQIDTVLRSLASCFKILIDESRPSVIHALLQSAVHIQWTSNVPLLQSSMYAALELSANDQHMLVERLLNLITHNPRIHQNYQSAFNSVGCQLIGDLLHIAHNAASIPASNNANAKHDQRAASELANSVLQLSTDTLYELAQDTAGSRMLDTYVRVVDPVKYTSKLQAKLAGKYVELACHMHGSYVVERLYDSARDDSDRRLKLCLELTRNMTRLNSNPTGRNLARKFRLELLQRSQHDWIETQQQRGRTLRTLENFLDESMESKSEEASKAVAQATPAKRQEPDEMDELFAEVPADAVSAETHADRKLSADVPTQIIAPAMEMDDQLQAVFDHIGKSSKKERKSSKESKFKDAE